MEVNFYEMYLEEMALIPVLEAEEEKKVLALYLEGMSYGQIAEQIGRPEKSVDNAIQRLKKKLKKVEKSVDTRESL